MEVVHPAHERQPGIRMFTFDLFLRYSGNGAVIYEGIKGIRIVGDFVAARWSISSSSLQDEVRFLFPQFWLRVA